MQGTLSLQTLRMAIAALEKIGVDTKVMLAEAQISKEKFFNPFSRIMVKQEQKFWKLAYEQTANPQMALAMAAQVPYGTYPLLEYIGASCGSLYQAMVFFGKYAEVIYGDWHPSLSEIAGGLVQFDLGSSGNADETRFTTEFGIALLFERLRNYAVKKVPLSAVYFRHPLIGNKNEYENFFGVRVEFSQDTDSLIFEKSIRTAACKNSDSFLLGSLLNLAEKVLHKLPGKKAGIETPLVAELKKNIRNHLPEGEPTIQKTARDMATSKRSLQRALKAEGTSLTRLVTEVRKEMACELLANEKLSHEEIALSLGYSTLSAFNRAFKQWFKLTPSQFKKIQD